MWCLLLLGSLAGAASAPEVGCCPESPEAAACKGASPCKVCTDCSRCAHCKGAGSCGTCSSDAPDRPPSSPGALAPAPATAGAPAPPAREPRAGDRAKVVGVAVPAAVDEPTYRAWARASTVGSDGIVADMYARRRVVELAVGTHVLVVRRHGHRQVYGYESHPTGRLFVAVPLPDLAGSPRDPLEVRVLDGEFKGQARFIPEDAVALPPQSRPKPADPATRAATALKSAQNLEKAKKVPGALGLYRQVVRDYPGTPEATAAAGRIGALGGR